MKKKICADCGEVIDDWQAPNNGAYRYEGRNLCRRCYLDAVKGRTEENEKDKEKQ